MQYNIVLNFGNSVSLLCSLCFIRNLTYDFILQVLKLLLSN